LDKIKLTNDKTGSGAKNVVVAKKGGGGEKQVETEAGAVCPCDRSPKKNDGHVWYCTVHKRPQAAAQLSKDRKIESVLSNKFKTVSNSATLPQ
jgi:16S rRNA G1207 methylase RsmC